MTTEYLFTLNDNSLGGCMLNTTSDDDKGKVAPVPCLLITKQLVLMTTSPPLHDFQEVHHGHTWSKFQKEFTKAEKSYIRHVQTPELLQRCMYVRHKIVK
jgi:hypothetical protein